MNEGIPNIRFVPKSTYRTGTFQHPPRWFIGKVVKVGFRTFETSGMEWMWVRVESNTRWALTGRLDNDPVVATYMRCGDEVTLRPYDVVAIEN